jgi:type IV pilus assembly protein PilW
MQHAPRRGLGRPPSQHSRGFSLVELMVAMAVTLFVILALTALFTNNSVARREIDNTGQQIENGRHASELLRDDVRLAGYYGEWMPAYSGVTWQLPANPCDPTLANLGWNATTSSVPVAVSGFEGHDSAIAALSPQCISNRVPNSDVLVVRRTSTTSAAPPPGVANAPFLQVSLQSSGCTTTEAAFVLDIVRSPSPFALHQRDCTTASPVRRYYVHIYYVSTCDDCASNDRIPTLKRVDLGEGAMTTSSLVQGIADFRVEYGLDTNNDGAPDVYQKCGSSSAYGGPCTAADWANVMTVKVYLLGRNLETTQGYVDRKTYTMGLSGTLPAFGDSERGYRHHVYSAPIRVNGQSDFREIP